MVLFSDLPTNLGNRSSRFPHSHRHDYHGIIPKTSRLRDTHSEGKVSGARNYFGTILAAFNQGASYFKLKTEYWQFLGLDTAYTGGSLSHPETQVQWDWLVANLNADSRTAIFLTHHQPVSAHAQETQDSQPLRDDVAKLLGQTRADAIYGWFFGHEHRAIAYDDSATPYKASVNRQRRNSPRCAERGETGRRLYST